jgi:hypothetical protein
LKSLRATSATFTYLPLSLATSQPHLLARTQSIPTPLFRVTQAQSFFGDEPCITIDFPVPMLGFA